MYHSLFATLTAQDVVLTANRRLAGYLQQAYAQYQHSLQLVSWESLQILPLGSFIQQQWPMLLHEGAPGALPYLNTVQAQWLWQKVVRQSEWGEGLLSVAATARAAEQAWQLLQQWQVPLAALSRYRGTPDTLAFQTWAAEFMSSTAELGWLDSARLLGQFIACLQHKVVPLPKRIFFVGFAEFTPVQQQLIAGLAAQNCQAIVLPMISSSQRPSQQRRVALADTEQELQVMALWAKNLLQQGHEHIGLVVPNLQSLRGEVEYIFTRIFQQDYFADTNHLPFNISIGQTLANFPIVRDALLVLQLNQPHLDLNTISALLRSPFLAGAEQEASARARLEVFLRGQNKMQFSRQQLHNAAERAQPPCPLFARAIKQFAQYVPKPYQISLPSQWAQWFQQQLQALGFPGERVLNSTEFQAKKRLEEALQEFSALDYVASAMTLTQALAQFSALLGQTIFQPKKPENLTQSIQILGTLEALGLPFEQLWIMGLHDRAWPAAPAPHSLLPIALQRELDMPHASAEKEYVTSQHYLTALRQNAENIILSYPQQLADQPLRMSALIAAVAEIAPAELALADYVSPANALLGQYQLEQQSDDYALPITLDQPIRGGSRIFQLQAACPFRAFATLRLQAQTLAVPQLGLDAKQRGALLHQVLENFWQTLKTQQALLQYTELALRELISTIIAEVMAKQLKVTDNFSPRFIAIEQQRLEKILWHWLQLEKQREEFTVLATEQQLNTTVADITLELRIDRVDQLSDGTVALIDYKTNEMSIQKWLGERPDEPQLPLYCIAYAAAPVTSLMFAQLCPDKMAWKGVAVASGNKIIKALPNWPEQVQQWRTTLAQLGQAFLQGYAKVDPKDPNETCNLCELQSLCRINANAVVEELQ